MIELTITAFDDRFKAGASLNRLLGTDVQNLFDSDSAAAVSRQENGKIYIERSSSLTTAVSGAGDGLWGLLIGLLFLMPFAGGHYDGTREKVHEGYLTDVGFDDGIVEKLKSALKPGTSVLFVLSSPEKLDALTTELARLDGEVFQERAIFENRVELREGLAAKWQRP